MARKKFDVEARVSVKDDASKNVTKIDSRFKRLTKTIRTSALAQAAAIGGVVIALRAMVRGMGAATRAANKQEDAINALEGALAPLGEGVAEASKELQEFAAELQKVTKFGDEEIIEAQALIASFVKETDAIKAATVATLDLAEAKGFSLVSAADLISKTLGSSTNALTRYGIEVTGAVGSTERLTTLTENIATVFGGRATKATETFSGAVQQLANVMGDEFLEAIGGSVTGNQEFIDTIRKVTEQVPNFTAGLRAIADAFRESALAQNEFVGGVGQKFSAFLDVTLGGYIKLAEAIAAYGENTKLLNELEEQRLDVLQRLNEKFTETNAGLLEQIGLGGTYEAQIARITEEVESAADAQERLAEEAGEAATAMEKLGDSLDQVTSAELSAEILEIETNLEAVRVTTGGIGPEFERLEQIATAKIASIGTRIEGLTDGLGDAGKALDGVGDSASDTGDQFDTLGTSVQGTTDALSRQATQARTTTRALEGLTAAQESLTLAQMRTALAATQAARKRITGVSSQSSIISDFALSPFGTGGRYTVDANGNLVPA